MRTIKIRHIEYFLEVAKYKSFSKASKALHVSQPAISKAVKELEDELEHPLFLRTTNYVRLSESGERILNDAQKIIDSLYNIKAILEENELLINGKVSLGIPPITAITSLDKMLVSFQKRYPRIQMQLFEYGPKKIEASLKERLIDIGIFTPETWDPYKRLWLERDLHDAVIHESHPLAERKEIDYKDLAHQDIIIYNSDYKLHDMIIRHFATAGCEPGSILETIQTELMFHMALAGIKIAIMPHKKAQSIPKGLIAIPFNDPDLQLRLAFTWLSDKALSFSARKFLQLAEEEYGLTSDEV